MSSEKSPVADLEPPTLLELRDKLVALARGAQDRPKARFLLAISALLNLSKDGTVWSRKELLGPPMTLGVELSKSMLKELSSKSWLAGFVTRLVEQELVDEERKSHELLYCSRTREQRERLLTMATAALFEDGRALKALLWPHDDNYAEPVVYEESEPETADAPHDQALDTITELTSQLSLVATHLQGVVQGFAGLDQKWTEKFSALDGLVRSVADELQSIGSLRTSLAALLHTLQDERRVQLTSILERVIAMQSKSESLTNQLESEGRKKERLFEDLRQQLEALK